MPLCSRVRKIVWEVNNGKDLMYKGINDHGMLTNHLITMASTQPLNMNNYTEWEKGINYFI